MNWIGLFYLFKILFVNFECDGVVLEQMVDLDRGEVDHTRGAKLGPDRDTFPSICGAPHSVLQKRLHLRWSCCHETTCWCSRAWKLRGKILLPFCIDTMFKVLKIYAKKLFWYIFLKKYILKIITNILLIKNNH